jgi:para-nitrobenzyl esterase
MIAMTRPVVRTKLGGLRGIASGGAACYRDVPYASAARFRPPLPPVAWQGVRDAARHGPVAPQLPSRLRLAMGDFTRPQNEDCLSLTIATPLAKGAPRPVMVWLHGGAYISGAGSLDWYDGASLAVAGDMVVVGVNYRLGVLGFLHQPEMVGDSLAIQDICAALAWIAAHIAAFGGDPGRVTLMGQSAGAHAIMCLLAHDSAPGLFHRAILQSPPAGLATIATAQAAAHRSVFLAQLGLDDPEILDRVALPDLLAAQAALLRLTARPGELMPPLAPIGDRLADPADFIEAAAAAAGRQGIALLVGTVRDEMHAFYAPGPAPDQATMVQIVTRFTGSAGGIEPYEAARPDGTASDWLADLLTDVLFTRPTRAFTDAAARHGVSPFLYRFDWSAPATGFGACHCIELPFLLGNWPAWRRAPMLGRRQAPGLRRTMQAAWAKFAHGAAPWQGAGTMRFGALCELVS